MTKRNPKKRQKLSTKDEDTETSTSASTKVEDPIEIGLAKRAAKAALGRSVTAVPIIEVDLSRKSRSSPLPVPYPLSDSASPTSSKEKCVKCKTRFLREGCTQLSCLLCCDDFKNCEVHRKPRLQAEFKTQILEGTHFIQQEAGKIRSRLIHPLSRKLLNIREPNIIYQGDTVVIWDIRAYASNIKWRDEAIRRSLKRQASVNNNNVSPPDSNRRKKGVNRIEKELSSDRTDSIKPSRHALRNNRKRFHSYFENVYQASLQEVITLSNP